MYRQMFSINIINNGVLSGAKVMPQKDSTSDNTTSFAAGRHVYSETNTSNVATKKKWIGGNRDASQVTSNSRNNQIGSGSFNASGNLMGFTTYKDVNTVNDALRRVRAGGAVAPAKKAANTHHAYTPVASYLPARPANDIVGIKYPVLHH